MAAKNTTRATTKGGTAGKGGINPAPAIGNYTVRCAAEQLTMVPIDDLVPYARNAKTHSPEQILQLRASLREFGFVAPVLIDFDNNIIAGHGRVMAARAEGMSEVPCVLVSNLTDAQRKAYILADNKLAEAAGWNMEMLKLEMQDLQEMDFDTTITGFSEEELKEIDVSGYSRSAPGTVEEADAKEDGDDGIPPETCPYHPGDTFRLGRHLLVCGDCTSKEIANKFQRGGGVNLLLTDPPYGVEYVGKTADALTIENDADNDAALESLLTGCFATAQELMDPGAGFYIWHASSHEQPFLNACRTVGWHIRETLIWNKNHFVLGRQDYQWKHEPCLYGWKDGAGHYWNGGRAQSTVLDFSRPTRSEDHPTMRNKPRKLEDAIDSGEWGM